MLALPRGPRVRCVHAALGQERARESARERERERKREREKEREREREGLGEREREREREFLSNENSNSQKITFYCDFIYITYTRALTSQNIC